MVSRCDAFRVLSCHAMILCQIARVTALTITSLSYLCHISWICSVVQTRVIGRIGCWMCSSVGQSASLMSWRSRVRTPPHPSNKPFLFGQRPTNKKTKVGGIITRAFEPRNVVAQPPCQSQGQDQVSACTRANLDLTAHMCRPVPTTRREPTACGSTTPRL